MEKAMICYAGLDVSLRTVNICVIDDESERVAETKLATINSGLTLMPD